MKIVFISDTHGQHRKLKNLPKADLIIHGGDLSNRGKDHEVEDLIHWFTRLDYAHKIFIAGNHDFYLEEVSQEFIQKNYRSTVIIFVIQESKLSVLKFGDHPLRQLFSIGHLMKIVANPLKSFGI